MKFVNVAPCDLHFVIDGDVYDVPVGGTCEIEDRIAYVVAGRGLPMKPEHELGAPESATVESATSSELRTDGPTMEEYVLAGYKAETYPPAGFAEKSSAGLDHFRENGGISKSVAKRLTKDAAQRASVPPPAPSSPEAATGSSEGSEPAKPDATDAESPKSKE